MGSRRMVLMAGLQVMRGRCRGTTGLVDTVVGEERDELRDGPGGWLATSVWKAELVGSCWVAEGAQCGALDDLKGGWGVWWQGDSGRRDI